MEKQTKMDKKILSLYEKADKENKELILKALTVFAYGPEAAKALLEDSQNNKHDKAKMKIAIDKAYAMTLAAIGNGKA